MKAKDLPHLLIKKKFRVAFTSKSERKLQSLLSWHDVSQVLLAGGDPKHCLVLNVGENDRRERGFVLKHPHISLTPNCPTSKHGEGHHRLPVCRILLGHIDPPILDEMLHGPTRSVKAVEVEPSLDHTPKPPSEPTLEKEVVHRFLGLFTKRTYHTIWPSASLKPIHRPNSVLNCKPSKKKN
jgi:hypothetical protein